MHIKLTDTKVVLGPVRLSYVHLLEKRAGADGNNAKYSACIMLPKSETDAVAAIEQATKNAYEKGVVTKWRGMKPKVYKKPLRDGDEKEDPNFAGMYFMNASAQNKPQVINRAHVTLDDPEDVYSGMWAFVSLGFFPYENSGNKGVACGINAVMKDRDDEKFGGSSAKADFADIEFSIGDDEL